MDVNVVITVLLTIGTILVNYAADSWKENPSPEAAVVMIIGALAYLAAAWLRSKHTEKVVALKLGKK